MASIIAASRGQLCLRSTFIDIEDDTPGDELCSSRRSRSVPILRSRAESSEVFDGERAYVSELSEKLASFWARAPAPEEQQQFGSNAVCGPFGKAAPPAAHHPIAPMSNPMVSEMLLRTKVAAMDLPPLSAAPTDGSATCVPSSGAGSDRAESVVEDPAGALNHGSAGHPDLCSRPCLYFASGQCSNGVACDFCHLPHPKRPGHLDKKHREALRAMSSAKAQALMYPIVRDKVLTVDASPATVHLLERLAFACGVAPTAQPATTSRGDRTLIVALAAMSLRVVLASLQRAAVDDELGARSAAEALMAQLRRAAGGAADA